MPLAIDHVVVDQLPALLGAAAGAGLGSIARDLIVRRAGARWGRSDLGILVANLLGTALAAASSALPPQLHPVIVLGVAGGLSTWSGLALEVAEMIRRRQHARIALHLPVAFAMAFAIAVALRHAVGEIAA